MQREISRRLVLIGWILPGSRLRGWCELSVARAPDRLRDQRAPDACAGCVSSKRGKARRRRSVASPASVRVPDEAGRKASVAPVRASLMPVR